MILADIKSRENRMVLQEVKSLNKAFDTAIDNAASYLVQAAPNRELILNKEEAVSQFFNTLYAGMGIMSDKSSKDIMDGYIPVIIVTAEDGYYVNYSDTYKEGEYTFYSKRFSEKKPYYYEDENFIYGFTLGDMLTLYDKNKTLQASTEIRTHYLDYHELQTSDTYKDFKNKYRNHFLLNEESFQLVRKQSIISSIEKSIAYYINKHNLIATNYGISYQFTLPIIDNSEWVRSMDYPSMFILFQGHPVGTGMDRYNRFSFAGAKIRKSEVYYLEQKSWYYLYHKDGCTELHKDTYTIDKLNPYYDEKDCIIQGAYACELCITTGARVPDYKKE